MLRSTLAFLLLTSAAVAQTPATTPTKPLAFEVVSIRPSKPGTRMMTMWGTTPDGYRVTGQSLRDTILMAYFPQGHPSWTNDRIGNAPSWLGDQYRRLAEARPRPRQEAHVPANAT